MKKSHDLNTICSCWVICTSSSVPSVLLICCWAICFAMHHVCRTDMRTAIGTISWGLLPLVTSMACSQTCNTIKDFNIIIITISTKYIISVYYVWKAKMNTSLKLHLKQSHLLIWHLSLLYTAAIVESSTINILINPVPQHNIIIMYILNSMEFQRLASLIIAQYSTAFKDLF